MKKIEMGCLYKFIFKAVSLYKIKVFEIVESRFQVLEVVKNFIFQTHALNNLSQFLKKLNKLNIEKLII